MTKIKWIERIVAIGELKPYEKNPRTISAADYAKLKASIVKFGQFSPLVVTQNLRVASGHQRLKAFAELGWTEVRVSVPDRELTHDEFKEILIRANVANGQYDFELLKLEFTEYKLEEYGVDDLTLKPFRKKDIPDNADDLPAIDSVVVTQLGDIWTLDGHRLCCGDSTNAQDVALLLAGATPHLMVTDPPYGVEYDANWRNGHDLNIGKGFKGKNARATGKVMNDDRADWTEAWVLFPGNIAYIWHGGLHSAEVQISLENAGFKIRSQIIWAKQHFVFGRGDYHWQHEPCWYAVKDTGNWAGDRKQTTLWQINNNNPFGAGKKEEKVGHSTQKPVECMKRPIENNSKSGDSIYEPFSGSGTTIIAAEITGRKCYAMEISPEYCDMAIRRWVNFTGKIATRESDGMIMGAIKM